ncbi:MAG: transposase [Pirellulaceae bacterium]
MDYFITWNTYGTWLPGDARGWRKRGSGQRLPRPLLENWCREQMRFDAVELSGHDRVSVEAACNEHCQMRGWSVLAVNARSNHVHIVVVANAGPKVVRDQLKANCTRCLREQPIPLNVPRTWAKGGDIEILDTEEDIQNCVAYVLEAQ